MNVTTRRTRACTLDALDADLKSAIRAHASDYRLMDLESDILMCCETITVRQKKGFLGGIRTTLSAVYVTPKWLVWADSSNRNDAAAGTAKLRLIDLQYPRAKAHFAMTSNQGLTITGRYTERYRKGNIFIVLDGEAEGQKFRQILDEALRNAAK